MPVSAALKRLCSSVPSCRDDVLESALTLAQEIVQESGEGRPTGALITVGRAADVLRLSRPLILDPLRGHAAEARHLSNPDLRGTVKALAQLDGAFVVDENGTVVGACRYLNAPTGDMEIPLGLGSRHVAAASISKQLGIVVIVVSQSGMVRTFFDGALISDSIANGRER